MREIRFRAFHKENKTIVYFDKKKYITDQFQGAALLGLIAGDDSGYLMQFTGLLDKNGKEIYEGDIVAYFHNCEEKRREVVSWAVQGFNMLLITSDYEVIGNIYENPELLEKE